MFQGVNILFHALIFTSFPGTFTHKTMYRRPSGSHRIATYLRDKGWDIEVIDFALAWSFDQLKELCRQRISKNTIWIGLGGTFPIYNENLDTFFKWVKLTYPHLKIIVGGQISNLYKIEADWYINGFAEKAIEALCHKFVGNSTEKLWYSLKNNGRKYIDSNKSYPAFPMKSLKVSYQKRDFIQPDEMLNVEIGRGCVFKCSFCNFPILGVKEDHTRDSDDFFLELQENYDKWGVSMFSLADETVNDYSEKLEKFATAVKKLNYRPKMFGFARGDLFGARRRDWDTMLEMGFIGHHYGLESTNKETLKSIGKGNDPDKILARILEGRAYMRKHGDYKATASFIVGLQHETRASFEKTLNWIKTYWKHENTILFPLAIQKIDGGDNPSTMSSTYKDLGYRETKENLIPEISKQFSWLLTHYGMSDMLLSRTVLSWENDEWNIYDAYKIVADFYDPNVYNKHSGPVIWQMDQNMRAFNKPLSFFYDKTNFDLLEENVNLKLRDVGQSKIDEYITNKLNWIG